MRVPLTRCPVCDGRFEPVKFQCQSCHVTMEGRFPTSKLALLSSEQHQFVEAFLVARGNIKEVEKELDISYPTVRKRLEEVVQALGHAPQTARRKQSDIIDAVDRGDLTAQEGIEQLKNLG